MSKFHASSTQLPKNARVLGYGGIDVSVRQRIARACWPQWLQALVPVSDHARRLKGDGWISVDTGEVLVSPYIFWQDE
ncbi:hypothetical protein [Neopusillimonas aromaticivorans]|uniref:hypothetical protein n=1 Tax=Neopusillimonas aromaticivorans TaxID=2979868 RepID=UPI0025989A9D|nr:hypothetical protein [Neopusillimonas aromaticivorans]WJJ93577.1 hypothetical protein N7E01_17030 [Neopusillimonas aromaticivorans]